MEHDFIRWIKQQQTTHRPEVVLGIGDDAAIVNHPAKSVVISTDMIADGTHFLVGETPLEQIGRKSLAVNLSDIAAMGARPVSAVVSILFPNSFSLRQSKDLFRGIMELANEFQVSIIGGDTNSWDGRLVINCAVTGVIDDEVKSPRGWRVDGAKVGDAVLVSGDLGRSIEGKHLHFTPRLDLANYLQKHYLIHAATDLTDSLTIDLALIGSASQVGIAIETQHLPLSPAAQRLAENDGDHRVAFDSALFDGEDFELAIVTDPVTARTILNDKNCPQPVTRIGWVTEEVGLSVVDENGDQTKIQPRGYVH